MEVYSFSIWFLIFGTRSYVLCKVIHSLLWFVIIRMRPRPYESFIVFSFNFSSFRPCLRFYLCLFFIPFVSYHWIAIQVLSKIIYLFYTFFVIGMPIRPYLSLIVCSFNFSPFRHHPSSVYVYSSSFCLHYWNAIQILSKLIYLFYSLFVIGTAFWFYPVLFSICN